MSEAVHPAAPDSARSAAAAAEPARARALPSTLAARLASMLGTRLDAWLASLRRNPVRALLLTVAAVFYALHFVHLSADFPNHSPWDDWSKYTDEGWYGDAAIRHYLTGHWYWAGDFNPAVALPVWPALELVWFRLTGVSAAAARALAVLVFGVTLAALYAVIAQHTRPRTLRSAQPLAAPLAVLLLTTSPFLFVFERMAILEPLLIALTALALLAASHLHPHPLQAATLRPRLRALAPSLALTLLLPAMVLTKTTAVFLLPSVFYMLWARAGYRLRPALRLALPPALLGLALWAAYFFLFVRPRYLEDYQYLFSANAYTGIALEPLYSVVLNTLLDGAWMGLGLYISLWIALLLVLFWRPRLLGNPLVPTLLLWAGGYTAFLAYHNNLQPRYYTVVAVPITAFVALCLDQLRPAQLRPAQLRPAQLRPAQLRPAQLRPDQLSPAQLSPAQLSPDPLHLHPTTPRAHWIAAALATAATLAIVLPGALRQLDFLAHPTWEFQSAARSIARIVRAEPNHSRLILSISGSDLTLMTGLPSIDDDFGTLDLDQRVRQYRPGWYVAWNDVEDDKADALTPLYTLTRVAAFPALDDPDRNLLILYRLDPAPAQAPPAPRPARPRRRRTPHALVTHLGQQPSTSQLEH